jgi:hypothetical protein
MVRQVVLTSGSWTRPNEFATGLVVHGRSILVMNGTTYANTQWGLGSPTAGITIDTTSQTWTLLSVISGTYAPLASPALTGTPTAPTQSPLTNNTDIATTAYTDLAVGVETTRAQTAEALKAPLASPALTGTPTAPTATAGTNTTQLATTAFVETALPTALPPFTTFTATAATPVTMAAGTIYTANTGATVFNLPSSISLGQMYGVQRGSATAVITVTANTGQSINGGTSGGSINMTTTGAIAQQGFVWLLATSSSTLQVIAAVGTDFGAGIDASGTLRSGPLAATSIGFTQGLYGHSVTKTATYTTVSNDFLIRCTTNSFTLTMGTSSIAIGQIQIVTNEATNQTITLAAVTGTVDLTTLPPISGAILIFDGTNWHTVGSWGTVQANQIFTVNTPTVTAGAVTVPITSRINNIVVSATTAITITTTGAVDGQQVVVRLTDGGTAETISWVNTENSTILAPLTSPASTTLPTTVGFQYNGNTSKWRCIGLA